MRDEPKFWMSASEMATILPSLKFMSYGMCWYNYIVGVRAWDRILEGRVEWSFNLIFCSPLTLYLFTIVYLGRLTLWTDDQNVLISWIYPMVFGKAADFTLEFSPWWYFLTQCFFIPQVSRFFVEEGKISMLLFFSLSEIRWWKLLTLCKKTCIVIV